nr:MAG TPA: hypothetical protein [Caudoviricetes sp.]
MQRKNRIFRAETINCTFCLFCAVFHRQKCYNRKVLQYNTQLHTGQKHGLLGMQKCLPSTFQPALQPYMGSNLNTDKPLCRPAPPISLVCQTKCNVFLPPKIIPTAYMESPRMGPYLPYKPTTPNRKTSQHKAVKRATRVYL